MKKTKLPSPVVLLILTLVTTVMWVGFSIYRAFTQKPAPSVPEEISAPLNPSLDVNTINKVESSLFFNESQIPALNVGGPSAAPTTRATLVPTPTPAETPLATPSATPSGTPEATPTP